MSKANLERKVRHYETVIEAMQGHTFYCEDDEGILRRWCPPRIRSDSDLDSADRIMGMMQKERSE